jgi:hypothetical protein
LVKELKDIYGTNKQVLYIDYENAEGNMRARTSTYNFILLFLHHQYRKIKQFKVAQHALYGTNL